MAETLRPRFSTRFMRLLLFVVKDGRPLPVSLSPDDVFIRIDIVNRTHTDHYVRDSIGHPHRIGAKQSILLDDNEANRFLSWRLANFGIPPEEHPNIISTITSKFRTTRLNIRPIEKSTILIIVFKIIRHVYLSLHNEDDEEARAIEESMEAITFKSKPAAKSVIDALEELTLDSSDSTNENCVICMEKFELGIKIKRLPCFHNFHGDCIAKWLKISHMCPLCRFEMPTEKNLCNRDD